MISHDLYLYLRALLGACFLLSLLACVLIFARWLVTYVREWRDDT